MNARTLNRYTTRLAAFALVGAACALTVAGQWELTAHHADAGLQAQGQWAALAARTVDRVGS